MASAHSPSLRVSLRDVAQEAGVSHVTVWMALRGSKRVSERRRVEIAAIAERLGYRPDPLLTALSAYRQARRPPSFRAAIAWLNQWPDPRQLRRFHEFDAYWKGAYDYASKLGYRLEEFVVGPNLTPARLQQILLARGVHGILLPPHANGLNLAGFDWTKFSVVRLGTSIKHPRAHIVTSDQRNGASMAFERMWEAGYRRIGYVSAQQFDRNTGGNFRAGYLSSQDDHVPLRRHLPPMVLSEESIAADVRAFKRWFRTARPDGLITTLGNLGRILDQAGIRVPEDLGVCTTSLLDGHFDAGVDQNSIEVGRVAVATLAALIQQNECGVPQYCRRVLVEGHWVDGSSLPTRRPTRDHIG